MSYQLRPVQWEECTTCEGKGFVSMKVPTGKFNENGDAIMGNTPKTCTTCDGRKLVRV